MNYNIVLQQHELKSMDIDQLLSEYGDAYLNMMTTFKFSQKSCLEVMCKIQQEIESRVSL
jgi:hypothetical protein